MSGLVIIYSGEDLVKEKLERANVNSYGIENKSSNKADFISIVTTFQYLFKPKYEVQEVIKDSPAFKAGLLKGDIIKRINGEPSHTYSLDEINRIFSFKPGRKVSIEVNRDGIKYKFKFKLERRI